MRWPDLGEGRGNSFEPKEASDATLHCPKQGACSDLKAPGISSKDTSSTASMLGRLRPSIAPLRPHARRSLSTQLHRLLRLDEHVDPNTVRAAYLNEVKRLHPDTGDGNLERFLNVQRAWESYRPFFLRPRSQRGAMSSLEMVMLSFTVANGTNRDIWTDDEGIHQMRTATVETIAQDMTKAAFPEANVRRVEVRKSVHGAQRLQVHVGARDPRHREALVARWDPRRRSAHSSAAFVSRLQENLVSAGGPSASLELEECLSYSWLPPPSPALVKVGRLLKGEESE